MTRWILSILFSVAFAFSFAQVTSADPETVFKHPPESAKPGVLWMWMGSNVNQEHITRDLEALKKEGFNRTTMFSLSDVAIPWSMVIEKSATPEIVSWTEPWWKLVRFAAEESKRLKMDFGMFNGSGYETSGGPWITPEHSMQEICYTEMRISGKGIQQMYLPKPMVDPRSQMAFPVYNPETKLVENPVVPSRLTYFKDIAVLAMPVTGVVNKDSIFNLTSAMDSDGTVTWNVPAGEWVIYRFGHTTTGALIQPAQPRAIGLECDKMNQEAVDDHIDHVIHEIQTHLGDLIGTGFTHVHFDSYEAGLPTWTPKMGSEFQRRRGYDLVPWLGYFAKRTIASVTETEKFKDDFNETIKDLYADIFFRTVSRKLAAAHLDFLAEPYGGPWRQDDVLPLVKNVMTEFWTDKGEFTPFEFYPTVAALRKAGKNIIEAEAFTGQPAYSQWSEYPAWLKPIGDAAFCAGVNRIVIHRFVHQPWNERYKPGNSMGQWGTHFDRTQTWWEPAKAMVEYWQRCQSLLQWGSYVEKDLRDFEASNISDSLQIGYIHRKGAGADAFFVANTKHFSGSATCRFNISGMQPELWDPVTGSIRGLSAFVDSGGQTRIEMNFADAQSYFVVFRRSATPNTVIANRKLMQKALFVFNKPWNVHFDPLWGGPVSVSFPTLTDWTQNSRKGIKYYSGTAVYQSRFSKPRLLTGDSLLLDLGTVNHIARVKLNGTDLGVVWTAPWQLRIPVTLLQPDNRLEIEVTNEWANRLIGDEQEPADLVWLPNQYFYFSGRYLVEFPDWFLKNQPRPSRGRYCFTTWNYFNKDSPLLPSGLLGPVRLLAERNQ